MKHKSNLSDKTKKRLIKTMNNIFNDNHPEKQVKCKHCGRLYASWQLNSIYDCASNGYKCVECGGYFA